MFVCKGLGRFGNCKLLFFLHYFWPHLSSSEKHFTSSIFSMLLSRYSHYLPFPDFVGVGWFVEYTLLFLALHLCMLVDVKYVRICCIFTGRKLYCSMSKPPWHSFQAKLHRNERNMILSKFPCIEITWKYTWSDFKQREPWEISSQDLAALCMRFPNVVRTSCKSDKCGT